ncbi:hypothetical protein L6452_34640 [Arctium lappa]|uniref:Uncharacterized protein n=1 Tax=Arctium lappa TaxID=4217 RepID=A0ACB8YJT0_ARCLA|nr:hypothetical protein L6452_34640 [Arctium lappa]
MSFKCKISAPKNPNLYPLRYVLKRLFPYLDSNSHIWILVLVQEIEGQKGHPEASLSTLSEDHKVRISCSYFIDLRDNILLLHGYNCVNSISNFFT